MRNNASVTATDTLSATTQISRRPKNKEVLTISVLDNYAVIHPAGVQPQEDPIYLKPNDVFGVSFSSDLVVRGLDTIERAVYRGVDNNGEYMFIDDGIFVFNQHDISMNIPIKFLTGAKITVAQLAEHPLCDQVQQ